MSGLYEVRTSPVETFLGGTYRLERRDIFSTYEHKFRHVWCWQILTGFGQGDFGGKCATKAEARKTVRSTVRAYKAEAEAAVTA